MLREARIHSIFQSGVGTTIAAEIIESCKYAVPPPRTGARPVTAISPSRRSARR